MGTGFPSQWRSACQIAQGLRRLGPAQARAAWALPLCERLSADSPAAVKAAAGSVSLLPELSLEDPEPWRLLTAPQP